MTPVTSRVPRFCLRANQMKDNRVGAIANQGAAEGIARFIHHQDLILVDLVPRVTDLASGARRKFGAAIATSFASWAHPSGKMLTRSSLRNVPTRVIARQCLRKTTTVRTLEPYIGNLFSDGRQQD